MIQFYVKRLDLGPQIAPRYHLFDGKKIMLLVTDPGQAGKGKQERQVRLSRPDGKTLATLEIPKDSPKSKRGTDYAIVYNDAVYAVISKRFRPEQLVYFVLEVEQEKWLLLSRPEQPHVHFIFDYIPAGFNSYNQQAEPDHDKAIGTIIPIGGDYHYHITLNSRRLYQMPLVTLALVLLVEQS